MDHYSGRAEGRLLVPVQSVAQVESGGFDLSRSRRSDDRKWARGCGRRGASREGPRPSTLYDGTEVADKGHPILLYSKLGV
jgi:hypothetical protein